MKQGLILTEKYKSLIEAKIPDIQGGVFSPDGEVLYCNNPKIVSDTCRLPRSV